MFNIDENIMNLISAFLQDKPVAVVEGAQIYERTGCGAVRCSGSCSGSCSGRCGVLMR